MSSHLSGTVYTRDKSLQSGLRDVQTLWNDLGFSLYAMLSVCHVVITSDGRKESEMGMSADWCVIIEYWRLSSTRVIFVNYQTSELQCNYQSYIQEYTIKDAQGFSDGRLSWIGVFSLWKMEYCQKCEAQMLAFLFNIFFLLFLLFLLFSVNIFIFFYFLNLGLGLGR